MTRIRRGLLLTLLAMNFIPGCAPHKKQLTPVDPPISYDDGRASARYRLEAIDEGVVYRHGFGPSGCDSLGARDVFAWRSGDTTYMHYDGAGTQGWLACLAVSTDPTIWIPRGPVLSFGLPGSKDSGSASYGVTFQEGDRWHLFYVGTPNTSPPPERIPAFPYLTLKGESRSPAGPWKKRYDIVPFSPRPGTYYSACASPGQIIRHKESYLMFFSASTEAPILRTIGIARTKNLDGPWTIDPAPIFPPTEQVENSALYYEEETGTWFLFTNHVGLKGELEYTDAVWVYWTTDPDKWDPLQKAVVLDDWNCGWSKEIVGLPSVVRIGDRLALFYDGYNGEGLPPGAASHMGRDIGLAWLKLPLDVSNYP